MATFRDLSLLQDLLNHVEDQYQDPFLARIDAVLGPMPAKRIEDPLNGWMDLDSDARDAIDAPSQAQPAMEHTRIKSKLLGWGGPPMTCRDHSTEALASMLMDETPGAPSSCGNAIDELLALFSVQEPELASKPTNDDGKADLQLLQHLGSTLHNNADNYIDASVLKVPSFSPRAQEGVWQTFPGKLFIMLHELELQGKSDIASFCPHSRAFFIFDRQRLATEVLPNFFSSSKWSAFARQLQLYSFRRVNSGVDEGACKFGTRDRRTYRS